MKRMLFNATHAEETRVGIVDGQKLIDIDIETAGREARKSNIYKGVVTRIEPSLEACFVDYGEDRHGFLPFKEISRSYFAEGLEPRSATISEAIREGQELVVQVEKEERGTKGAALTTFISLAGRYLVLMPNNPRAGGVSRRIEGEERQELREAMDRLDVPRGMSTIARTAGIGRTTEELQWDLNYLLKLWEAILDAAEPQYEQPSEDGRRRPRATTQPTMNGRALKRLNPAPYLIVEESNLVVRAIRDYFQPEIGEILVDTDEIYEQARQFMSHVMPDMISRVKRYREDIPLFTRFQVEQQIETAYSRTVPLPSGGAIVIDHTEALVAVDVNSARATRGADIEETAFRTNLEAADEVARQMRLRDLGGLIVIDFIDMVEAKNQRAVEQRLKDAIRYDRARVQLAKISRFGLMELSRQRLRPSLSEGSHVTCPRCNGVGVIRDTESCALQVLRILQEEAMKEGTGAVQAQVPVDVATFLLNEKRNDVTKLEARHRVPIVLIPNTYLETPHYHIERIRQDDDRLEGMKPSFTRVEEIETTADDPYAQKGKEDKPLRPKQEPVIKTASLKRDPAPVHKEEEKPEEKPAQEEKKGGRALQLTTVSREKGIFSRIIGFFLGSKKDEEPKKAAEEDEKAGERPARASRRSDKRRSRADRPERTERASRTDRKERPARPEAQGDFSSERPRTRRTRRAAPASETSDEKTLKTQAAPAASSIPTDEAERQEETARRTRRSRRRRTEEAPAAENQAVPAEVSFKVDPEPVEPRTEEPAAEAAPPEAKPEVEEAVLPVKEETRPEADAPEGEAEDADGTRSRRRRRPRRRKSEAAGEELPPEAAAAETEAVAPQASEPSAPAAETPAEPSTEEAQPRTRKRRSRSRRSRSETSLDANAMIAAEAMMTAPQQAPEAPQYAPAPAAEALVQIETKKSAVSLAVAGVIQEHPLGRAPSPTMRTPIEESLIQVETKPSAAPESPAAVPETPAAVSETPVEEAAAEAEPAPEAPEAPAEPEKAEAPEAEEVPAEPEAAVEPAEEAPAEAAPQAEVPPAEEAEKAEVEPEPEPAPADDAEIAQDLTENLARAGLTQVQTKPELVSYQGYEAVRQPGRAVVSQAPEAEEGELVQVQTRADCVRPAEIEPVRAPGRVQAPRAEAEAEDEGPLIQVQTRRS